MCRGRTMPGGQAGARRHQGQRIPKFCRGERLEIYGLQKDINTGDLSGMLLHCAGNRCAGK